MARRNLDALSRRRRVSGFWFLVTRSDGHAERETFYARTQAEADEYAHAWARRMGVEVEPAQEIEEIPSASRREAA